MRFHIYSRISRGKIQERCGYRNPADAEILDTWMDSKFENGSKVASQFTRNFIQIEVADLFRQRNKESTGRSMEKGKCKIFTKLIFQLHNSTS